MPVITVAPGQSLWSLAKLYYGNGKYWQRIYAANPQLGSNPNLIQSGATITIPEPVTQQRKPATPTKIAPKIPPTTIVTAIADALAVAVTPLLALRKIASILSWTTVLELIVLGIVLRMIARNPVPKMIGLGAAQVDVIRLNQLREAAFVEAAAKRMLQQINDDLARGLSREEAVAKATRLEQLYFNQHVLAQQQRMQAANRIDGLAQQYGPVLGWYDVEDAKTTPECRAAAGKNFSALTPPIIGWPGIVHMNCRCYPGPPYANGAMLP
jgi:hypothetical protein